MIIITGANGTLGRAVVEKLLKRIPAEEIGVSVRDVTKAKSLEDLGVRVRQGDFNDSEQLLQAFEGASQVLIVSSGTLGEVGLQHHQTAIDSAKRAGAERILYTSHMGASETSKFPPMPHHAATEEMLKESDVAFTSLRNGYYASSLVRIMSRGIQTGELIVPESGPFAWTTHADLAHAAAVILTEQKKYDGCTPNLTAIEAFDMKGAAALASDILGREIRHVVVSEEDYREHLLAHGLPEFHVNLTIGMFRASRDGDFSSTNTTLADMIRRPPQTLKNYLSEVLTK